MEDIETTLWNVIISGTGLQQSLLALALSRSDKKILHVDQHDYYGGAEAAFSLQEVEQWVKELNASQSKPFLGAGIDIRQQDDDEIQPKAGETSLKLSFPRAYSLAFAPQIIYTRSALLPALVSSKVDSQLEFLAVGSWFIYTPANSPDPPDARAEGSSPTDGSSTNSSPTARLARIPAGREDILNSTSLPRRSKQLLTKFLRFLTSYDSPEQREIWLPYAEKPFHAFLSKHFNIQPEVQEPIQALVLAHLPSDAVTTEYALNRIARHLGSMGLFGEGFAAIIPKWGGMAEIAQVGCRACAVGGGVYMLGNGVEEVNQEGEEGKSRIRLAQGETVNTRWLVSDAEAPSEAGVGANNFVVARSIAIVSSPLESLFHSPIESGPVPAVAIVAVPTVTLSTDGTQNVSNFVYIMVHSSDTGESPKGQSILYASVGAPPGFGAQLINQALEAVLSTIEGEPRPQILWRLRFEQRVEPSPEASGIDVSANGSVKFPQISTDLAFDDSVLDRVKEAWEMIMTDDKGRGEFLRFERREQEMGGEGEDR